MYLTRKLGKIKSCLDYSTAVGATMHKVAFKKGGGWVRLGKQNVP